MTSTISENGMRARRLVSATATAAGRCHPDARAASRFGDPHGAVEQVHGCPHGRSEGVCASVPPLSVACDSGRNILFRHAP
jgi:hypothetical protein